MFLLVAVIVLFALSLSFRVDAVRHQVALYVTEYIKETSNLPLHIGKLRVHRINKIEIDTIVLNDLSGDTLLQMDKLTAHLSVLNMLRGHIKINTVTLASPKIRLTREDIDAPLNAQFVLDYLSSDSDSLSDTTIPRIRVNQLQMYDGEFSYRVKSYERADSNIFSPHDIALSNVYANISLKELSSDTLSLYIRKLSGKENCGLSLDGFTAQLNASQNECLLHKMKISFPRSRINANRISLRYTLPDNGEGKLNIDGFDGKIYSEKIHPKDFSPFIPELPEDLPEMAFVIPFKGYDGCVETNGAEMFSYNGGITVKADVRICDIDGQQPHCNFQLKECEVDSIALDEICSLFADTASTVPQIVSRLGNVSMNGTYSGNSNMFTASMNMQSDGMNIVTDMELLQDGRYNIALKSDKVLLGRMIGDVDLGKCIVNASLQGVYNDSIQNNGTFDISFGSLEYKGYSYSPININGVFDDKRNINVSLSCADKNLSADANFSFDKGHSEKYRLSLNVDSVFPYRLGLYGNEKLEKVSFGIFAEHNSSGSEYSVLNTIVNNLRIDSPERSMSVDKINVVAQSSGKNKTLLANAGQTSLFDLKMYGQYDYKNLPDVFARILGRHLPSLFEKSHTNIPDNNFIFNARIPDSEIVSWLFDLPVTVHDVSTLNVSCNDKNKSIDVDADFRNVEIRGHIYDSVCFDVISDSSIIDTDLLMIAGAKDKNSSGTKLNINCSAVNDVISSNIEWREDSSDTNRGKLDFDIELGRDTYNNLGINAKFHPGTIIYSDSLWKLNECTIKGHSSKFEIDNLTLSGYDRSLCIDGIVGAGKNDSLTLNLYNIDLEEVFNLVNFHPVDFGGIASGEIILSQILEEPMFSGHVEVEKFTFEHGPMGHLSLDGFWKKDDKTINLLGYIKDGEHLSIAQGIVSPANDTINIRVAAGGTRVDFLNHMLGSFIADTKGRAYGEVYIRGKLSDVNLYGVLSPYCSLRLRPTNVTYNLIGDTIYLSRDTIAFRNFTINDIHKNRGIINGVVSHTSLKNFNCRFNIDAESLLAYDTKESDGDVFWGKAYVNGDDISFVSDDAGIRLKADVVPSNKHESSFEYNASAPVSATDNRFVTIVDRNAKQHKKMIVEAVDKKEPLNEYLSRLTLGIKVSVNPSLYIKVYTNRQSGDYIQFRGNGDVDAIFDEKNGFTLGGNLNLTGGEYKFTLQAPKIFKIQDGSSFEFNGDPFEAKLGLKTVHMVPSVSLSDLTPTGKKQKSVDVKCLMDIKGTLSDPELKFGVELADGNEEAKELLASATSTEEQVTMQFLYLLGIGKFYTYDSNGQMDNQSSTVMESLIARTISGQLNNLLSQISNSNNWNFSGNFTTSERGWNSMEVEGMLSGRLLDNRLLINGNFGYRENPLASKNFIGDFEIQWLLNRSGNVSLKAYSKTNDRYFSKTSLTTQGAGIMLRHDFDNWLFWLNKNRRKEKNNDTNKK